MTQGVYYIKNKVSGKMYVGSSKDIEGRFKNHIRSINKRQTNFKMLDDVKDFGLNSFTFGILEVVEDQADLLQREYENIEKYSTIKNGYNTHLPSGDKNINITVLVNSEMKDEIDLVVYESGGPRSAWLLKAIKEKLERDCGND